MALGMTLGLAGVLVVVGIILMLALLVKVAVFVAWVGLALFVLGIIVAAASRWMPPATGRPRV
jgi:hypothetical protein